MDMTSRFIRSAPSDQVVLDLFAGEWSSAMPAGSGLTTSPGHASLFNDTRIEWAAKQLGPFEGKEILEFGPLEGAHSYMLQKLGARSITAVEANTRAYLKCLCIKEIFKLDRVQFLLGSFVPYMSECRDFDAIVASGILYHLTNPVDMLFAMIKRSNRIMLWTHYYDPEIVARSGDRELFAPEELQDGTKYIGSKRLYREMAQSWTGFSGGSESYAVWLKRSSIISFFETNGYQVSTSFEDTAHPNGPSFAICARR